MFLGRDDPRGPAQVTPAVLKQLSEKNLGNGTKATMTYLSFRLVEVKRYKRLIHVLDTV